MESSGAVPLWCFDKVVKPSGAMKCRVLDCSEVENRND